MDCSSWSLRTVGAQALSQLGAGICLLLLATGCPPTAAQTQTVRTQQLSSEALSQIQRSDSERLVTDLDARDRLVADIWGLSADEMSRAKVLMQGPRAAFSVSNLSPLEALGIHARSESERRKYAQMLAKAFHADVQRSLAWNNAFQEAIDTLTRNDPLVSFEGLAPVRAPVGSADAMNVPRTLVLEAGATGPSSRAFNAPPLLTAPVASPAVAPKR